MAEIVFHPIRPEESHRARAQRLLQASYSSLPDYRDLPPDELLQRVYRIHSRCASGNLEYQRAFLAQPMDLAVSDTFSYWFSASPCTGDDLAALIFQTATAIARGAEDAHLRLQLISEIASLRVLLQKLFPDRAISTIAAPFSLETDLLYQEDMEYLSLILLLALPDWAFLRVVRDVPSLFVRDDEQDGTKDQRPGALEQDLALLDEVQQVLAQIPWEDQPLLRGEPTEASAEDQDQRLENADAEERWADGFMRHLDHLVSATEDQLDETSAAGSALWELLERERKDWLTTRRCLILMRLLGPICSYYLDTYLAEYLPYEPAAEGIDREAQLYGAILETLHSRGFLLPRKEPADSPVVSAYWRQQGPDRDAAYWKTIPAAARPVARAEVPLFQEIHAMADRGLRFPDRDSPDWLFGDLEGDGLADCACGLYQLLREDSLWVDTTLSALLLRGTAALSCWRRFWLTETLDPPVSDHPPAAFLARLAPLLDALYDPDKSVSMQDGAPASCFPSTMGLIHNCLFVQGLRPREETAAAVWSAVAPAVPDSDVLLGAITVLAATAPALLERYRRQQVAAAAVSGTAHNILTTMQQGDGDGEDAAQQ